MLRELWARILTVIEHSFKLGPLQRVCVALGWQEETGMKDEMHDDLQGLERNQKAKMDPSAKDDCSVSKNYVAQTARDIVNYSSQVSENYKALANPFSYYERLVDGLLDIADLEILPLYELAQPESDGRKLLGLRHDIDADPFSALRAARSLSRRGICGSFYLLHTAPYYGDFIHGVFVRNPQLVKWIQGFIVAGCELGIHNDALGICTLHGKEGVDSFCQELAWLRSQGARILGSVAHNSGPVYGAENFEIFQEHLLWPREVKSPSGYPLPLSEISEKDLQLTYEGTFAVKKKVVNVSEALAFFSDNESASISSESWMRRYLVDNPCCDWSLDFQFWLLGRDSWVAAGQIGREKIFEWDVTLLRVLSLIEDLPMNTRSTMVIHPAYLGG